jgi:glycosyltransferase involved in cell wall biosynthesis
VKVAIAHDYLVQYGGAERVVESMLALWPDAPVYTSMLEPERMPPSLAQADVRTSFLQRSRFLRRHSKAALPLYPAAMRSLDLSGFDLVVSSSSGWAHGVRVDERACHVVYCHTPARWLYRTASYGRGERLGAGPLLPLLRGWDRAAAHRPDVYVANSANVRRRIREQYGRDAEVVHPPVETGRFAPGPAEDFYLCASRLNAYKRIDLAVAACRRLGRRLLVAGDGPSARELRRAAGSGVELLGRVSDATLADLFRRCRALIVPAEEDFCITAVEAMASGRPVIGYARGGLLETILPDRTGVLFERQTDEGLAEAIERLERLDVDPDAIRAHAVRFDTAVFRRRLAEVVVTALDARKRAALARAV